MPQDFLLTADARTISVARIMTMTVAEAEEMFAMIRWPATNGKPVCPKCSCDSSYDCRRPNGAPRWRCKKCLRDFSLTSGTSFAYHKLPIRDYLAATVMFVNGAKGKAALELSRATWTSSIKRPSSWSTS